MNIDSGLLDGVRVEDMSNAELYQYLFKADLDEDLLPLGGLDVPTLPSTAALDAAAAAAATEAASPSTTSLATPSPSFPLLSPGPPPPYSPSSSDSLSIGSSSPQEQPLQLAVVSSPTLLSSSSFSYRQLTPNMPPSKPSLSPETVVVPLESAAAELAELPASNPSETSANAALVASMLSSANAGSYIPTDQMNVWVQRFQQLQQLQQMHHRQQQELLSSRLLGSVGEDSVPSSFSPSSFQKQRSASPAGSSSSSPSSSSTSPNMVNGTPEKDKDILYPSPPMRDDMALDSDSDGHGGQHGGQEDDDRDPLKPSPSELKKMTSKERRQLRNKLSARNFRVRRKEYIGSLENQVKDAKKENAELQRKLVQAELNIQFLRQELETVRLQQSLFTESTMTRDHANLLASLLNPSTEVFPSSSPSTLSALSSSSTPSLTTLNTSSLLPTSSRGALTATQQSTWQQQQELMNSIHFNNMTILNNTISSMPSTQQSQQQQQQRQSGLLTSASMVEASTSTNPAEPTTASIQPFIPFDSNWELSVNRAEVPDANIDPKQGLCTRNDEDIHELLVRYEEVKQEYERDEQMRMELKAYSEERLARSFVVMPPLSTKTGMPASTWSVLDKSHVNESHFMLQAVVYIMMMQLTKALFEAATLSKTQIVDMFQKMDGPLRSRMLLTQSKDDEEKLVGGGRSHCKFSQWREAWIRKCWPSFYNNRQRLCALINNHLGCQQQEDQDAVQLARLMEEGAAADLELATPSLCERARYYLPDWLKCPNVVAMDRLAQKRREERNALIEAARARQQQQQQQQQAAEAVVSA
ncbi:hypothetical protein DFQ27_009365 [Actinomortierella ambigua]|uniref:BZIP domain-containing protein n=1 Tax=Actinomortierella ambigua TaxID=1343610 RepID=A0A9P6QIY7_9FUNG|nr:hypothetical protein DFQ27_009365 [Actinomortierella ambigua]